MIALALAAVGTVLSLLLLSSEGQAWLDRRVDGLDAGDDRERRLEEAQCNDH